MNTLRELLLLATLVFVLTLENVEAKRRTKHGEFQTDLDDEDIDDLNESPKGKTSWHKYAKMATSYSKNAVSEEESSYCHKVALKRCGNSFMKVFQLFTFLPEEQSFHAKCASRTAFYSCLKKFSSRPCMSSWHFHIEEKFRKRLADNLWSARTCVLGIVPGTKHSEKRSENWSRLSLRPPTRQDYVEWFKFLFGRKKDSVTTGIWMPYLNLTPFNVLNKI